MWAAIHLFIALPLNLFLPRATSVSESTAAPPSAAPSQQSETFAMVALAYVFAAVSFVGSGLSAVLPIILAQFGATAQAALFAGMLIGPAQVGARIIEAGWLARYHPLLSARVATLTIPVGMMALLGGGPLLAPVFAIFFGAGNGILTIARGSVPLALYGPVNYGYRLGILGAPSRMAQAASPLLFGVLIDAFGGGAFFFSAALGLAALASLCMIRTSLHRGQIESGAEAKAQL